jgi:tRNA pseudouridine32 synthase / 23S rRNA pseudouridine746 synthase
MAIDHIFQNQHFLAVDKPAGWLSVPSRDPDHDERRCLGRVLQELHGRVWPVHRLDAEASGLMLFARSAEAHRKASSWFENRLIHKTYAAWTMGSAPSPELLGVEQVWQSKLARGKRRAYQADFGKPSVTRATCLGPLTVLGFPAWAWSIAPETGRSHQIRFELASHGFPIVGDSLYGADQVFAPGGIALPALRLDFSDCQDARGFELPVCLEATPLETLLTKLEDQNGTS